MSTLRKAPWESLINRHGPTLKPEVLKMLMDLTRMLSEQEISLTSLLNQGLRFPDNFDGALLTSTTDVTPDTEFLVPHGLHKVPSYFIVLSIDKAGSVYQSAAFDATNIKLKSTASSAAITVFVF